jgi:hypothetical protein
MSEHFHEHARAGLEHDLRKDDVPYIAKSPHFCDYAEQILSRGDIVLEHVFVPMRDLYAAAESRRHVLHTANSQRSLFKRLFRKRLNAVPGGLWHTRQGSEQEPILLQQVYKLLLALSGTSIPLTFLHYPTLVKDSSYLYEKLLPILSGVDFTQFHEAFLNTVRPELVHSFGHGDR